MEKSIVKYNPHKLRKSIIISLIIGVCIDLILISVIAYIYGYFRNILKDILSDKSTQELLNGNVIGNLQISSYVYDKNGDQIGYLYGTENRIEIQYSDLPKNLINAIITFICCKVNKFY